MTGSQESGMATASSTAPPKVMVPLGAAAVSAPKMVPERTAVKRKRAVMTRTLTRPRVVIPMIIHRAMRAPMMRSQSAIPKGTMISAAAAALTIMTAVQPMS